MVPFIYLHLYTCPICNFHYIDKYVFNVCLLAYGLSDIATDIVPAHSRSLKWTEGKSLIFSYRSLHQEGLNMGQGGVVQVIEHWLSKWKALSSNASVIKGGGAKNHLNGKTKFGGAVCSPSTREADARGFWVLGQPGIHSETVSKHPKKRGGRLEAQSGRVLAIK
jgi:hypothetical protein